MADTRELMAELTSVTKKAAKDRFKAYLESRMEENAKGVAFMMEMFDAAYDLIENSIEDGGMPSKGYIIKYFADKSLSFGELSSDNRVACAKSAITMIRDAKDYLPFLEMGLGIFAYTAVLIYDGLDTFENCDLAYLDYKAAQQTEALKQTLEARAKHHAQGIWEARNGQTIDEQLAMILDNQCRMPSSQPNSDAEAQTSLPATMP